MKSTVSGQMALHDVSTNLIPGVIRFRGRDIVRVRMGQDVQGFYRSSGRNSGMPGRWFPFDGLQPGWFDKSRFCRRHQGCGHPLERYGEERYRLVGERLGSLAIPPASEVDEAFVNVWLKAVNGSTVRAGNEKQRAALIPKKPPNPGLPMDTTT